jgi:hypothetical protein
MMAALNNEYIDISAFDTPVVDDPAEQKRLDEENRRALQSAIDQEKHALGDDLPKK